MLRDEQSKYKAKKQMHRQFEMITPGGVNMRKTTLSEMCGSNVLKMLAKQYQYVIRLIKEGSFLCLPNVLLKELRKPQTDWRKILNDFIQEEIVDYSFTPPDRRFDDSPFFLPDFNDKTLLLRISFS